MRYLGIDYGQKRIGLALSDDECRLAFPREIVKNGSEMFERIASVAQEEDVGEIVLGESINSSGLPNKVMKEIAQFAENLRERLHMPIHFEKEFFTSVEARRYQEEDERADAKAAALILQRYLDRKNKSDK